MLKLAFTGTRAGLKPMQFAKLTHVLQAVTTSQGEVEWHDGDCIGADKEAHDIIMQIKRDWATRTPTRTLRMIGHPGNMDSFRAGSVFDELRDPKDNIERNHDMVDESEVLVACPAGMDEERRSGTWSTIRYAQSKIKGGADMVIMFVWPDGTLTWKGKHHE